jgi:hypothetical protein
MSELAGWLPDAEQMLLAGRAIRMAGALLLHVGGILILLF